MNVITQRVQGKLLGENGRTALLLHNPEPTREQTADSLYLRFAFVLQGTEMPVFPEELLDDWGSSIKRWQLYEWVLAYGDQFPRAEIFGFDGNGRETQHFLRDLEMVEPVRCYAYADKEMPLAEGVLVEAVLMPVAGVTAAQKVEGALVEKRPLSAARLTWWQVPPETTTFRFT